MNYQLLQKDCRRPAGLVEFVGGYPALGINNNSLQKGGHFILTATWVFFFNYYYCYAPHPQLNYSYASTYVYVCVCGSGSLYSDYFDWAMSDAELESFRKQLLLVHQDWQ